MNEEPEKQENNRNPDGTFIKGVSGNPAGRPKGQSLKEFWKERLAQMTPEEKLEFSKAVGKDTVWKMSEGMPKADIEVSGELTSKIIRLNE